MPNENRVPIPKRSMNSNTRWNTYRLRFVGPALLDQDIAGLHSMERELGNFYLTESHYPPRMKVPKHSHENASIYFILRGSMSERYDNISHERGPATLVFTPPGQLHSNQIRNAGCRLFMIEAKPRWLASLNWGAHLPDSTTHLDGSRATCLARRAYTEACHPDALSPVVIEGLTLEILAEVSRSRLRAQQKGVPWLEKARDIVHARFASKLTINDLAKEIGVHPVYFASAFRRRFGCTVGEYIRHLRIENACALLHRSHSSLTEIALAVGFFDQSHFSRTFKLLIGTTPARYRAWYQC